MIAEDRVRSLIVGHTEIRVSDATLFRQAGFTSICRDKTLRYLVLSLESPAVQGVCRRAAVLLFCPYAFQLWHFSSDCSNRGL